MKKLLLLSGILFVYLSSFAQCADSTNIYSFTYKGQRYEVVKENKSWSDAVTCAVSRGGYLAHINDKQEDSAVFKQLSDFAGIILSNTTATNDGGGGSYVWLGGNDLASEGAWIWDGDTSGASSPFWNGGPGGTLVSGAYQNWGTDAVKTSKQEPDNYFDLQDVLAMGLVKWPVGNPTTTYGLAGQWNDLNDQNALYYLIEYDCAETTAFIQETSCSASYTSPSGKVWTTSAVYTDTIPNNAGCDSVITIDLTVNESTQHTEMASSCNVFTSPNGKEWTTTGIFKDTIANKAGCDSIITFDLTIVSPNNAVTKKKDTLTSASTVGTYQWLDCSNNYTPITGATNQYYVPTQNGEFAIEVTQSGCVDTSECQVFSLSSVAALYEDQIKIYPNPITDFLQISLKEGSMLNDVIVTDVAGRRYDVETVQKGKTLRRLNMSSMRPGTYMIIMEIDNYQIIRQVQKQ